MWTLELALTTLWMAGMVTGSTFGGWLHLLALLVLVLVFSEKTPLETRIRGFRFRPHASARQIERPTHHAA